jgi:hypothetical protein
MKQAIRQRQRFDLAVNHWMDLPGLLTMPGKVVKLSFRGARIRVLAAENPTGLCARPAMTEPVTDPCQLELLSGPGEVSDWPRPVSVHAIIEVGSDPLVVVQRASRWASYSARVAIAPSARLNDQALLEAQLRGVWLLLTSTSGQLQVAIVGEQTAASGSVRGLAHRLLDELVWEALGESAKAPNITVRPAATR